MTNYIDLVWTLPITAQKNNLSTPLFTVQNYTSTRLTKYFAIIEINFSNTFCINTLPFI